MSRASEARDRALRALQPYIDEQIGRMSDIGRTHIDPDTERALVFNAVASLLEDLMHLADKHPAFTHVSEIDAKMGIGPSGFKGPYSIAYAFKCDYDRYVKSTDEPDES